MFKSKKDLNIFNDRNLKKSQQRGGYTVMLIPDSEKKIINFKINIFSIIFLTVLFISSSFGIFYLSNLLSISNRNLAQTSVELDKTQANLEQTLNSISELNKTYKSYKSSLTESVKKLEIVSSPQKKVDTYSNSFGDLSMVDYLEENSGSNIPDIQNIKLLEQTLKSSINSIDNMSYVIQKNKQVISDMPSLWPVVSSVKPIVTEDFGPNLHPIDGVSYMHKGLDISAPYGTKIVSSANGKVIEVNYKFDYGLYVIVEHKYGFKTRYSHLSDTYVKEGDVIRQGALIGAMGKTGKSTGVHLHFEVILGTQVVDPLKYLSVYNPYFIRML